MAFYPEDNTPGSKPYSTKDLGFDANLNRNGGALPPPEAVNTFESGLGTHHLEAQEMGAAQSIGYQMITVHPTENIQEAIDKVSSLGGGIVRLLAATYFVDYDITIPRDITLQGDGREGSYIMFNGNANQVRMAGADASNLTAHARIRDLFIQDSGHATCALDIDYSDGVSVENVIIYGSTGYAIRARHSSFFQFKDVICDSNDLGGILFETTTARSVVHFKLDNVICQNNLANGIKWVTASGGANVSNGYFIAVRCNLNIDDGLDMSGSIQTDSTFVACFFGSNEENGVDIDTQNNAFIGCVFESNTLDGVEVSKLENKFIGCKSEGNTILNWDLQTRATVIGNNLGFGADINPATEFGDADDSVSDLIGNLGASPSITTKIVRMQSVFASSAVGGGKTVVHAGSTNVRGDQFDASFIGGDDRVCGMLLESTDTDEWGAVLVEGYTDILQVNGTDDIAIGDFLTLHSANAVARKAQDGEMAFAIALEAYTTDDSNGVISAILITPRKIGNPTIDSDQVTISGSTGASNSAWTSVGNSLTGTFEAGAVLLLWYTGMLSVNNDDGVRSEARIFDSTASAALSGLSSVNLSVNNKTGWGTVGITTRYVVPSAGSRTFRAQIRNSRGASPDNTSVSDAVLGYMILA